MYTDLVWVVSSILRVAVCLLFIHLEGCVEKARVEVVMPQYKSINESGFQMSVVKRKQK